METPLVGPADISVSEGKIYIPDLPNSRVLVVEEPVQQQAAKGKNYRLSSHILDITRGEPAPGVKVVLSRKEGENVWTFVDENRQMSMAGSLIFCLITERILLAYTS